MTLRDSSSQSLPVEKTTSRRPPATARITLLPALLVSIAALPTAFGLMSAVRMLTPEPARVEVDLAVSAGSRIALYVNDLTRAPLTQSVILGQRHRYVFDGIVEDITMLRIDPTNASGAVLQLHAVAVVGRDGILAHFAPQALVAWTTDALTVKSVDDKTLNLLTTSNYPIITTSVSIPGVRKSGRWTRWLPMVNAPDISWRLAAAFLMVLLVAASLDRARRLHIVLALAAVALIVTVLTVVARMPDRPGSAAVAVSRATFMGLSTRPAMLASITLAVGAVALGAIAALMDRRRRLPVEARAGRLKLWHSVVGITVAALVTSPNLRAWASIASTRQYVPNWDGDNLVYWAYLLQNGRLPMRDFWHPYAGAIVFELPFPAGPALRWLYDILLFSVVFLAIGKWRGAAAAFVSTAVLIPGQAFGLFPGLERYLLAPVVVIAYVSGNNGSRTASPNVLFWCACALALFIEPPQLLYAAIPVSAILAAQAVERQRTESKFLSWLERRACFDFGVPLGLALGACGLLALSGQLGGFLEMYTRLGDAVAYSAWPTGVPERLPTGFPRAETVLVCATILVAIGVYEIGLGGGRRSYGEILAGVGLVTLMVLQKHFVRWMDEQLVLFLAVSILALAVGWPGRWRSVDYLVGGVLLGALAATLAVKPAAQSILTTLTGSLSRTADTLTVLATEQPAAEAVNAARFAPARFSMYLPERRAVDVMQAHAGGARDVSVFALTDEMPLYILAGQRFVWISNMYDASPIYRQERVIRWLENERPTYVVFDPNHLIFDGFQMLVRLPLVFSAVVSAYAPLDVDGRIQILRQRTKAEPVALPYWRERLGSDVNVGRLASVSSYNGNTICSTACGDLLEVEVPAGGSGRVSVPLTIADQSFSISFSRVPSETTYRLLLDRVWFWDVAKRAGLPRTVAPALQPDIRARVRSVERNEGVLY